MSFWEKVQKVDNRLIYIVVFITLAIPMLRPMGIPLTVSSKSTDLYNVVESLQRGDRVLMSLDYTPLVAPEVHPATQALCHHLFRKGVRVAFYGYIEEGPMFGEKIINEMTNEYKLVYGTDVVNLGFVPGKEAGVRALGDNVLQSVPRDFRNNITANMPIMNGIKTAADFDLVLSIGDGLQTHVQQMGAVHGVRVAGASTAAAVSGLLPYLNSGQIKGFLEGLRGAAEYETLIGRPGSAVAKMDAQSLGHMVIIGFIVLGNVAQFMLKKKTA